MLFFLGSTSKPRRESLMKVAISAEIAEVQHFNCYNENLIILQIKSSD